MDYISALLLLLSVVLSSGRNLLSKGISAVSFGTQTFFKLQTFIFTSGAVVLFLSQPHVLSGISTLTFWLAVIYALLLLSAQWCYTAALGSGQVGICATVYSLGFIFPTFSGMLFWQEPFSAGKLLGIALVIPTILLSGRQKRDTARSTGRFLPPLLLAMVSSGGLGIVQKVQQTSPYPEQKSAFVLLAFLFAAVISFACTTLFRICKEDCGTKKILLASGAGVCFATCNLLNTILAGRLESAVFFPTLNIGSIFLSLVLSICLFKERLTIKHLFILLLGAASILLISLSPAG